jgi:glycosyltransferase involved in cell wall biosynthesis
VKALFVVHNPVFGGAYNELLGQRIGLAQRAWEVAAVTVDLDSSGPRRLAAAGVPVHEVPLHRLRAVKDPRAHLGLGAGLAPEVRALRRLIRRERPDVVQVHGVINPHAAIAAHLEGVAVCWHLYDMVAPATLRRALMPFVRRCADSVTTIGRALAAAHPGVERLGERLVVTSPPVDLQRFGPPDAARRAAARAELRVGDGEVLAGTVGTLFPNKGHLVLADAADGLDGVAVRALGGPSPAHAEYGNRVRARYGDRYADPGGRVAELIAGFDVFVMASYSEGMPATIVEAMGSGLPVVASDVGAVGELVQDGVTGLLVPPGDPGAVRAAILSLAGDPERRAALGAAGRDRVAAEFGVERVVERRVRAYELAVAHRRARS